MDGLPEELHFLEPSKTREADSKLRKMLLEILLLLATTRHGRVVMRAKKVYPILRELHMSETCEECDIAEDELVQVLMRDEGQSQDVQQEYQVLEEVLMEKHQAVDPEDEEEVAEMETLL